jgi:hypothetical protein
MNDIINEFYEKFSEHLEMYCNKDEILLSILAKEITRLRFENKFLQLRLKSIELKV